MRFHEFKDREDYTYQQVGLTRRKIRRNKGRCRPFVHRDCVKAILALTPFAKPLILCHGVRHGQEVDYFRQALGTDDTVIGTEITPELAEEGKIIHWDMTVANPEWVGCYHAVYSNSFDHTHSPEQTLLTWKDQLQPILGCAIWLEWSKWHDVLGSKGNKADCFAATLDEYRNMIEELDGVKLTMELRIPTDNYERFLLRIEKE